MTESVVDIIKRISPEFPIDQLLRAAPWLMPRDFHEIKRAIKADPCRNWRVVARRYQVSRRTVYRAWKMAS